MQKPPQY